MSEWERGRTQNREIATLRRRYLDHRETVSRLMADAPTERLAQSYARIRAEIDTAVSKLEEIDGGATTSPVDVKAAPAAASTHPALRGATEAEAPPLTVDQELLRDDYIETPERRRFPAAAVVGGILILLLLGAFVIWRFARSNGASSDRIVEESSATATSVAEEPVATPAPAAMPLTVEPEQFDYGIVPKGTRKTQKFTIRNNSETPVVIRTSRSECRCLWFQHPETILPGASGSLTITVDGARAKAGPLTEAVQLTARDRADISASVDVTATVQ